MLWWYYLLIDMRIFVLICAHKRTGQQKCAAPFTLDAIKLRLTLNKHVCGCVCYVFFLTVCRCCGGILNMCFVFGETAERPM